MRVLATLTLAALLLIPILPDALAAAPARPAPVNPTGPDGNGLAELDAPAWRVDGLTIGFADGGTMEWTPNGTSASLEHRYARSPLAVGTYRLTVLATKGGSTVASASRTFVIRDVATTMEPAAALANITPDIDASVGVGLVLADKNGAPLDAPIEARVFHGSTRAESSGLVATLHAPFAIPDADGNGRATFPMHVAVPALAAPGAYRVSIYVNSSLVGSVPFNVTALPTLTGVVPTGSQARLQLDATGTGDGLVTAALTDGDGTTVSTTTAFRNGSASFTIDAPAASGSYAWNVTLRAHEGGLILGARNGTWLRAEPRLVLTTLRNGPRSFSWGVDAPGWDLSGAAATLAIARWDGTPETSFNAAVDTTGLRLAAPSP